MPPALRSCAPAFVSACKYHITIYHTHTHTHTHEQVGKQAKSVMDAGGLVTDEIVIGIIKDEIAKPGRF